MYTDTDIILKSRAASTSDTVFMRQLYFVQTGATSTSVSWVDHTGMLRLPYLVFCPHEAFKDMVNFQPHVPMEELLELANTVE